MFRRKGLALVAACAALACGGLVRAADVSSNVSSSGQPLLMDDAAAAPKPLAAGLNKIGVQKGLDAAGISISGYVEGSYTFDANHPTGNYFSGRSFDTEQESVLLDQLDLAITRGIDSTAAKFDVGFTIEQIYGADAAYMHANGLTTYSPSKILGAYTVGARRSPKNQYDLNQAFLTFAFPIKGLTLTVGKFDTLIGFETINPSINAFFSHSFLFAELPFTQTGVMAAYSVTDALTITAAATRGWDQALKDTNGSVDALGQIQYKKDKWTLYLNVSTGDQEPSASGLNGWRTVFDGIAQYKYADNLLLAANADYGFEPQVGPGGTTAKWYGAAVYASYTISSYLTFNARAEWFNDETGGAPTNLSALGHGPNSYSEATLGLAIKPFPNNTIGSNLVIRPEVRVDYANHAAWAGDNVHDQLTGAIEAYFTF